MYINSLEIGYVYENRCLAPVLLIQKSSWKKPQGHLIQAKEEKMNKYIENLRISNCIPTADRKEGKKVLKAWSNFL